MHMEPYYDYDITGPAAAAAGGVAGFLMVFVLLFYLIGFAYGVLNYVLYSLSIYKIAKRRGIHHPWLAWLPIGNVWVLGSISDQYQYVAKGNVRNRRKVLLGLNIGMFAALIPALIGLVSAIVGVSAGASAESAIGALAGATLAMVLLGYLVMFVLSMVMLVFLYIALYDLYNSCEPSNAVLYLVLTIFFSVVLPFFLFACRIKDLGMPPRRAPQPEYIPAEPYTAAEPVWNQEQ